MTLTNLFTNQIMVARLIAVSGSTTKTHYSTVTAEIDVSIQRLAEEKTVMIGGAIGKTFRMFCEEDADVQVDDKLIDELGREFKVNAVSIPAQLGNFVHKECLVIQIKSATI